MRVFCGTTSTNYATWIAIALSTLVCQAAVADHGIQWIYDVNQAAAESQRQNKPMLIKVSTDWCGYCKKMQRETFDKEQIVEHVNQCFVPVYLDGDKHKSIVQQLGVRSYPTTVVLSSEGKVLSQITGFRTAAQLSVDLNRICPYESVPSNSQLAPIVRRSAQPQPQSPPQQSIFGGNCPVSPVETGKFAPANLQITSIFRGYSVSFASEAYRNAFAQNPAKYWPVADGMCIVSAAHGNSNKYGSLNNGVFYEGRIWLFADQSNRSAFEADPGKYLQWFQQQTQHVATAQRANAR